MSYLSRATLLIALSLLAAGTSADQQDAAAQRAEIANQRIQAEAEMRRRAEEAAIEAQQQAAEQNTQQTTAPAPPASPEPVRSRADMSISLQQIRTLGELRDAGYVTDEEFQRIKERILNGVL